MDFCQQLFTTSHPTIPDDLEMLIDPLNTKQENVMLIKILDADEIFGTLGKMSSKKAPGPDSMTILFFKHFWNVVGVDVVNVVQEFFTNGELLHNLSATNITMILKVDNPSKVSQFRPISFCNIIYKLISKILMERLKLVLPKLISPFQLAFFFQVELFKTTILWQPRFFIE